MKKMIRVNSTTVKEMTFEECLKRYKPMIIRETKKHTEHVIFNGVEYEDLMQELTIATWNAFNKYDVEVGTQFSTFLFNELRDGKRRATHHLFAKKRTAPNGSFSIEDTMQNEFDDSCKESGVVDWNTNLEESYESNEFVSLLSANLTDMEMDVLKIMVDEAEGRRADKKAFATKWGMSRPTAYSRIKTATLKIQELVLDNGYML